MGSGLSVVVVATGGPARGDTPDPLLPVCGRPLVHHVVAAFANLAVDRFVVVVERGTDDIAKRLNESLPGRIVECVEQRTARGSGDAVSLGLTALTDDLGDLDDEAAVVVVPGHAALLRARTIGELVAAHRRSHRAATLLSVESDGVGDVVRGRDERVVALHPEVPATERSTGVAVFRRSLLGAALRRIVPRYSFGESSVDDVVSVLADAGHGIETHVLADDDEAVLALDNRRLAAVEAELRRRINDHWMANGVTMVDPDHTYIDARVQIGTGTHLLPGCILAGSCSIGRAVRLGPDVHLTDCAVGDRAAIRSSSGVDAEVGPGADVGPYAVLAPGAQIAASRVTGPFYAAPSSAD